jgi:hypothetical protein
MNTGFGVSVKLIPHTTKAIPKIKALKNYS